MEQLFAKGIRLNRNSVEDFDKYPFNIPIIKNLTEIQFEKNIYYGRKRLRKIDYDRISCHFFGAKRRGWHEEHGV